MTLLNPVWLILFVPLSALWWFWRMPTAWLRSLRAMLLGLLLLAFCGLAIRLPSRSGTVVIVADRSLSMPEESQTQQNEAINLIEKAMPAENHLAVIAFGERSAVEKTPQNDAFAGFTREVGADGSRLDLALEQALALIPPEEPGRILIISDGRFTGAPPLTQAGRAATQQVMLDYRLLQRGTAGDVAIVSVEAPEQVTPGESYFLHAWIKAATDTTARYSLHNDGKTIQSGVTQLNAGLNRLTFRDQAAGPGTRVYRLRIEPESDDPVPENNTAKLLLGVEGPRSTLCLPGDSQSEFSALLQNGGLDIAVADAQTTTFSLENLSNYSAVVLENLPANQLGESNMNLLASWVRETGAGLMVTGGKRSYATGGYYKSPLENILPVSMELRREHRKLSLAMVIAMDRSGSMGAPADIGKTKMDLANLATVQVIDMLTEMDELGVVAVDSAAHVIVDCKPIGQNPNLRSQILKIQSGGGGIFCYTALLKSAELLQKATAGTRHIILFADAADAEEPGEYRELIAKLRAADVTVSVVGLGKPTDVDADFLQDIAQRGEGRIYFTESATELPSIFAQDTFVVARSTFVDEPTPFAFTGGMSTLSQQSFGSPPLLGGYNLCYLRDGANPAALSKDEYEAPIVASWQAGAGRVLCYTGQVDGPYTGPMAGWSEIGNFFTSLARWTAGRTLELGENTLITQEVENGVGVIRLHLDPARTKDPFAAMPGVRTLRAGGGTLPEGETRRLHWEDADTLTTEIPLYGSETALNTLFLSDQEQRTLPPICLPYSPEFQPDQRQRGEETLKHLAAATAGVERIDLTSIWDDIPRHVRYVELEPWLILAAIGIFLLEILERRTGILSTARIGRRKEQTAAEEETKSPPARRAGSRKKRTGPPARKPVPTPAPAGTPSQKPAAAAAARQEEPPHDDVLAALKQARQRSRNRQK